MSGSVICSREDPGRIRTSVSQSGMSPYGVAIGQWFSAID